MITITKENIMHGEKELDIDMVVTGHVDAGSHFTCFVSFDQLTHFGLCVLSKRFNI
jgi:hypothetical protein